MKRRYDVKPGGTLVDRDGNVLGTLVGLTLEVDLEVVNRGVRGSSVDREETTELQTELLSMDGGSGETLVVKVWTHYVDVHHPRNKELPSAEAKLIREALKVGTPEEVMLAISGCAASPFHMGDNERRRKYNALSQIIKGRQGHETTRERLDFFIDIAQKAGVTLDSRPTMGRAAPTGVLAERINRRKLEVVQSYNDPGNEALAERATAALAWLAEQGVHPRRREDDGTVVWEMDV